MSIEYKSAAFELKDAQSDSGTFEGYASVFGVTDKGGDIVQRGAFAKSLGAGRKVKMLWQHDPGDPIGVFDEMREDERGLFVKGRILTDIARGRDAMAMLKAGVIDSMSIGYRTIEAEKAGMSRKLIEVDLWEVSLVTFPMNDAATVTDVKSLSTERDFERFLRDAGYSRKEATAISSHGFKGLTGLRDAEPENGAETEAFKASINSLLQSMRAKK